MERSFKFEGLNEFVVAFREILKYFYKKRKIANNH